MLSITVFLPFIVFSLQKGKYLYTLGTVFGYVCLALGHSSVYSIVT